MTKLSIDRVQRAFADGRHRRAVNLGWKATYQALTREDRHTVEQVQMIAESIAQNSGTATAARARQLATYCVACLGTGTGQLGSQSELARLLQRGRNLRGGE